MKGRLVEMINKTAERIAKAIILIMGVLSLLGLGKMIVSAIQRKEIIAWKEIIALGYLMGAAALLIGFLIIIYKCT